MEPRRHIAAVQHVNNLNGGTLATHNQVSLDATAGGRRALNNVRVGLDMMSDMLPIALWSAYAIPAYVLWTITFRVRYGFSPVAERFPPRNLYGWMDSLLFVTLVGYSAWLVLGSPSESPRVIGVAVGVALWMLGVSLRWWAIAALGRNWRIGQDDSDERATFVATGPYRLLRHPINAALIVVAVGMLLMTGPDPRSLLLLSVSVLYYVVQARAENRRWRQRSGN